MTLVIRSDQSVLDRLARRADRVRELRRLTAARASERVPAAAAATDRRGRDLDDLASAYAALDERRRDRGDQVDPLLAGAAEDDRGVAELRLEPVRELEQRSAVDARHGRGQHPCAVELRCAARELLDLQAAVA